MFSVKSTLSLDTESETASENEGVRTVAGIGDPVEGSRLLEGLY
jgi:hypothetical protein